MRKAPGKIFRWNYVQGLVEQFRWRIGAELGVSDGKFTTHLVSSVPDLRMIAVDLWDKQPGNDKKEGGESYETWDHDKSYRSFLGKIAPWKDRVTIHRMLTSEAAGLVEDESLDFVFIDACHSYDCVMEDIRLWRPKVKQGGWVIGHDWTWPTVSRAVADSYPQDKIIIGPNKCWAVPR